MLSFEARGRFLRRFAGRTFVIAIIGIGIGKPALVVAQDAPAPTLRVGAGGETVRIDGILNEPAWNTAAMTDTFAQTDPSEGAPATYRTAVRVLASRSGLVIGIVCEDTNPQGIVSFSVQRDAGLDSEDHVRIVLGPFLDGRSGYVFAVNPSGARYDGLILPGPEGDDEQWDAIWEAETARNPTGWSVEIRIPIQSLSFKPGLREWHFNVQRRIQRLLETDRWASPTRQYLVTQTSRAGLLTDLPEFALGRGLTIRPGVTMGGGVPARSASVDGKFHPSLDVTQRLGSNVNASFTVNTDFAETEVDTRRTNLTRFPLFFPEKRTFFLEGADIFQFGLLQNRDVIPYFSRRMGLVSGREVPIMAGAKVNGRIGNTGFGGVVVGTNDEAGIVDDRTTMATARLKRNIWGESYVGLLATVGDPLGRSGSWVGGADFAYSTSRFLKDKNFQIGIWGLATGRDGLRGDTTSHAIKFDYPNEQWDARIYYKRVGRDFDPSLGFVPRRGIQLANPMVTNRVRLSRGPIQEMTHNVGYNVATDLSGRWESYSNSIQPLNWRFRSGDRVQVNVNRTGERLDAPFEISPGVAIPVGSYEWWRQRLSMSTAQKRRFYTTLTWEFGRFYDGDLDQYEWSWVWNPTALYTVEFTSERNVGRLASGRFTQNLVGTRLRINFSSDLAITSYAQYDTDSDSVGVNTRLRWTLLPVADLFIVYDHNARSLLDRWTFDSNQLLIKLQYAWRM